MKLNHILIFGLLGFCAVPATLDAQTELRDKKAQSIDLGQGVETTEFLTTAATYTITAEELSHTSAISLADALHGKLLGLTALQNTGFKGEEGRGASFNIRGAQTTGEKDILILVDGYERPIDRLSVEEVESVTVLRDAAAVALYGHEGVNGVLLVKTKRGLANSGFHFKAGVSHKLQFNPEMANMVSAYDYANALNQARINDGSSVAYTEASSALRFYADNASGTDIRIIPTEIRVDGKPYEVQQKNIDGSVRDSRGVGEGYIFPAGSKGSFYYELEWEPLEDVLPLDEVTGVMEIYDNTDGRLLKEAEFSFKP